MTFNEERAKRAARALLAYSDPNGEIVDLLDYLADVMHLCKQKGYDLDGALSMARTHFEAETGEPPTQTIRPAGIAEASIRERIAFDRAWDLAETFADEVSPKDRDEERVRFKTMGWKRLQKEKP